MAIEKSDASTPKKPLRLWPGVVAAALIVAGQVRRPHRRTDLPRRWLLGGLAGGLAIVVWWLFFSRAPWSERVGAIVLMIVALFATSRVVHVSIAEAGQGRLFLVLAIPVLSLALVAWAVASRRLSSGPRRASLVAAILLACGVFTLLRTGGISGEGDLDLHWRWTPTPEERLLAQGGDKPATPASPPAAKTPVEPPAAERARARRRRRLRQQ